MPTAVVAMLGMDSLSLPSEFRLGPSEEGRMTHEGTAASSAPGTCKSSTAKKNKKGNTGFSHFHKSLNVLCGHF